MQIFHYNPDNGEFLGVGKADPDPLEQGNWLIPAHATTVAPPAVTLPDTVARFQNGVWSIVPDFRGTTYWLAHDDGPHKITEIDELPPSGSFASQPPAPAPTLQEQRDAAVLDKKTFCKQLRALGVLPIGEASAAARGEWPATFAGFTAGLTPEQAEDAQIEWAGTLNIHYTHPLLQALALSYANDDQAAATAILDQIFGIT